MSAAPPQIFDRRLLRHRLERAYGGAPATFLLQRASEEMGERLDAIRRRFDVGLDLGSPGPLISAVLRAHGVADVVTAAPVVAAFELRAGGVQRHEVVDEEALPYPAQSFDLIVSALALQYVNDLPGVLLQVRRALRPDGLFLACMVGGRSLHELRTAFTQAEAELTGGASPRVAPFADVRDMGALLQRAGFSMPVTDVDSLSVRYDSMFALIRDLRAMGATNALVQRSRKPLRRQVLLRASELYVAKFADADGRVRATFDLVWLTGWAPKENG